jgi:DNA (cytosine-5)-methyltransferase 1
MFAKLHIPIVFPKPTHNRFGKGLSKWRAVKKVLDLEDEGKSIFDRRKPLVKRTLDRIAYGIEKFVLNGEQQFALSYYGSGDNIHSIEKPLNTLTTKDTFAIINAEKGENFLMEYYGRNNCVHSVEEPAKTISTQVLMVLIRVEKKQFLTSHIHRPTANSSLEEQLLSQQIIIF